MYLGYIKTSLRNKRLFTLLSILQVTITIILIIEVLINVSTINYRKVELNRNLNLDLDNTYQFIVYGNEQGKVEIKNELSKHFDIGSYMYDNKNIKEIINNDKFINMFNTEKDFINKGVPILKVDKNIFSLLDIDITDGRSLNEEDFYFKNNSIPIIFSEEYKEIVSIGDVISYEGLTSESYEVVGFYDKDIKWLPANDIHFFALEDLGKMGITIPSNKEKESTFYERTINSSTYITSDKLSKNEIQSIVNNANKDYELNIEVLSITDIVDRFKKDNYPLIIQMIFFSIFMVISSCLGLASNMSFTIMNRKREFGIRLANGFRKKDIKLLVISEMLFITLVSTVIAMVWKFVELYKDKQLSIAEKILVPQFTISDFIIAILLVCIIIIIASIIPLRNIDKLQPKEMIGGTE